MHNSVALHLVGLWVLFLKKIGMRWKYSRNTVEIDFASLREITKGNTVEIDFASLREIPSKYELSPLFPRACSGYFYCISIVFPLYFHPISTNKKAPDQSGAFALFLRDVGQQVNDLVGIAPFVVIPRHHLHKGGG